MKNKFPELPEEVFAPLAPKEVDLLVGTNYNSFHPGGNYDKKYGHVKIQESAFGTGWVISGSDKEIKASKVELRHEHRG